MFLYLMSIIISISGCAHWIIKDKLTITKSVKEGTFIKTEHKEKQNAISKFDKNTHNILVQKISTM
jgi:hypothetical protein